MGSKIRINGRLRMTGRQRSWPILSYIPDFSWGRTEVKHNRSKSGLPLCCSVSDPGPPKYRVGMLTKGVLLSYPAFSTKENYFMLQGL